MVHFSKYLTKILAVDFFSTQFVVHIIDLCIFVLSVLILLRNMLQSVCKRVTCSGLLEKMATDEQRSQGLDIADFLLMEDTPQMILQKMIERNPALQLLIDEFDLALVE